jgi:hypothetical protein
MTTTACHTATWVDLPDHDSGTVGQYYCSMCKLTLELAYTRHYEASATGWHWTIRDAGGQIVDSAGNKHAPKYESAVGALEEVKEEAVRRFNSTPCAYIN